MRLNLIRTLYYGKRLGGRESEVRRLSGCLGEGLYIKLVLPGIAGVSCFSEVPFHALV